MIPNLAVDTSRKEKIDIEIGTETDSDFSLSKILRDLDYDYVEDNLKNKESGEGRISGALFDDEEEPENPLKNTIFDDVINLDRKIDKRFSSERGELESPPQDRGGKGTSF
ncbi:hypothetical protein Droror1_Dr00014259 [Drosera rotundifolia]